MTPEPKLPTLGARYRTTRGVLTVVGYNSTEGVTCKPMYGVPFVLSFKDWVEAKPVEVEE